MGSRRSTSFYVYAGSIVFHATLAVGAVLMPQPKRKETVAISLFEHKKPAEPPKAPPPPPPPPKAEPPKARPAPAAAPAAAKATEAAPPAPEAAPSSMDGFADLGMALGNGGPGGIAIPVATARAASAAAPSTAAPVATTRKVRALAAKPEDSCDEPPVKAKPKSIVKATYTDEARTSQIEGVVRVELTVDEEGRVIQARVLRGLGYGLDDAAMAAAKQMTFEPGTRCGKAAVTTLSLGMRFALGS